MTTDEDGAMPRGTAPDHEEWVRWQYVPALDGVRAFAVMLVIGDHLHFGTHKTLSAGFLGVEVFFVLSGFLITTILLEEHTNTGRIGLGHFYIRRALRLLPLIGVLLAVALLFYFTKPVHWIGRATGAEIWTTALYIANWQRIWHPHTIGVLGHTWSLAIEEQFYLVWPPIVVLVLWRGSRRVLGFLAFAMCIALLTWRMWWWAGVLAWRGGGTFGSVYAQILYRSRMFSTLYFSSFSRGSAILVGCVVAIGLAAARRHIRVPRIVGAATVLAFAAILLMTWRLSIRHDTAHFFGSWPIILFDGAAAVLILGLVLHERGWFARVLSMGTLVWIGRRSYGLYVIHFPVFLLFGRQTMSQPLRLVLEVAISFGLAALSYRFLEQPILRRGARTRRLHEPDDTPPELDLGPEGDSSGDELRAFPDHPQRA